MKKIDRVIKAIKVFRDELRDDPEGRFHSWEHCYKCFHEARIERDNNTVDYDNLCLHLAFYLASWGMYRGSSFLLQKDYRIHKPVVKLLLNPQYDCLFGLNCCELEKEEIQDKLEKLQTAIRNEYTDIRKTVKKKGKVQHNVSNTLITKIIMGTLGCVPAYDRFFIDGVKELNVTTGNYSIKNSLLPLATFYKKNYDALEKLRKELKVYDLPYPQMKLLDMGFWEIGLEKHNAKRKAKR